MKSAKSKARGRAVELLRNPDGGNYLLRLFTATLYCKVEEGEIKEGQAELERAAQEYFGFRADREFQRWLLRPDLYEDAEDIFIRLMIDCRDSIRDVVYGFGDLLDWFGPKVHVVQASFDVQRAKITSACRDFRRDFQARCILDAQQIQFEDRGPDCRDKANVKQIASPGSLTLRARKARIERLRTIPVKVVAARCALSERTVADARKGKLSNKTLGKIETFFAEMDQKAAASPKLRVVSGNASSILA